MIKKDFVSLLAVMLVIICGGLSLTTADETYPILKLDFTNNNVPAETEPGFISFTIADSGSVVKGIKVEISGILDARRRWGPTGIDYEQIYRDFIFARPFEAGQTVDFDNPGPNEPVNLTLSGLWPNQTYEITIYSFDVGSAGDRYADWTCQGEFVLQSTCNSGYPPTDADDNAYTGLASSDSNGTIALVGVIGEEQLTNQAQFNQPFGFINGLVVSSLVPIKDATYPVPDDGATATSTTIQLGWKPGMFVVSHDVYIGKDFDDVNDATSSDPMGPGEIYKAQVDANNYTAENLTPGVTYYWRIDEVNDLHPEQLWKGKVWSFFVPPRTAYNPSPVDGSIYADPNFDDPNLFLSWFPGADATSHHVYFGDNLQDVQAGTSGTDKGTVTDPNYDPTGMFELNKTYYWRVDESDGTSSYPGAVWSFTTTLEGLGTVGLDMWESISGSDLVDLTDNENYPDNPTWSDYLTSFSYGAPDGVGNNYGARIHGWLYVPLTGDYTFYFTSADAGELWLSNDEDPANLMDGNPATPELDPLASENVWGSYNTFAHKSDPIPLIGDNKYYIMAIWKESADWDHCQVAWQGAGIRDQEIIRGSYLSPYEPVQAFGPFPRDEAINVKQTPVLQWKSGKYAALHNVYLGSEPDSLNLVTTMPVGQEKYGPITPELELNKTYYWRIDEVNNLQSWEGEVWSFTIANYLVVEGFEDYNDSIPDRIFQTWHDGFGYREPEEYHGNGTGSAVGSNAEPWAEQLIINSGNQSMPIHYDNTGTGENLFGEPINLLYSETSRQWDTPQNWTRQGVKSMALWFRGYPATVGSYTYSPANNGTFTVMADGEDIWGTADEFHFVYQEMTGDVDIIARVRSIELTDDLARAGVMIRDNLDDDSSNAFMLVTPAGRRSFHVRPEYKDATGQSESDLGVITLPYWIRLTRTFGNVFNAYYSDSTSSTLPPEGSWVEHPEGPGGVTNPADVTMTDPVYVGLAYTSRDDPNIGVAVFSNVTISPYTAGEVQFQPTGSQDVPQNDAEQLYVVIEDAVGVNTVIKHTDPNAVLLEEWTEWPIDLAQISGAGVDVNNIKKIYIGVGDRDNPVAGGKGKLYFDDIRLHPRRCVPAMLQPEGDLNDDCMVDYLDIEVMSDDWLGTATEEEELASDIDTDDDVDFADYAALADKWLVGPLLWP